MCSAMNNNKRIQIRPTVRVNLDARSKLIVRS